MNDQNVAKRSDKIYWLVTDNPAKDHPKDECLHGRFWWEKKTFIGMSSYHRLAAAKKSDDLPYCTAPSTGERLLGSALLLSLQS